MTATELLTAICAEIERLKETHERNLDKPMERGRIGHAHGYVDCCDEILAYLDTLQVDEPEVDLEKEIDDKIVKLHTTPCYDELETFARHFYELGQQKTIKLDEPEGLDEVAEKYASDYPAYNDEQMIAKYAFKSGAEWQREQMMKLNYNDDIQSAADDANYNHSHSLNAYIAFDEGFKAGAAFERERMMKDAVVCKVANNLAAYPVIYYQLERNKFKYGDKVKLIIVKEEQNYKIESRNPSLCIYNDGSFCKKGLPGTQCDVVGCVAYKEK